MNSATQQKGAKTMTAMIFKNIPRDEFGSDENGFFATVFDRVTVERVQERSATAGGNIAHCVNDSGEKFMVFLAWGEGEID